MAQPPIAPITFGTDALRVNQNAVGSARPVEAGNIFDDMLGRAIGALNNVSATEMNANTLIDKYINGQAELSEVMLATSKMTIAVQLAVTTVTSAVSSFKELTQMQI
jgi:flagellar hook-basal body complex protein FliE